MEIEESDVASGDSEKEVVFLTGDDLASCNCNVGRLSDRKGKIDDR